MSTIAVPFENEEDFGPQPSQGGIGPEGCLYFQDPDSHQRSIKEIAFPFEPASLETYRNICLQCGISKVFYKIKPWQFRNGKLEQLRFWKLALKFMFRSWNREHGIDTLEDFRL